MESNDVLRRLDRAAAAPFLDYPETPVWYPPAMGLYFAALAAGVTLTGTGHPVVGVALLVVAVVLLGVFFGWYRGRWGTWPDLRQAPPEIGQAYSRFALGMLGVVLLSIAACWVGGFVTGAVVTFVACTACVWRYERRDYPTACAKVRSRLA